MYISRFWFVLVLISDVGIYFYSFRGGREFEDRVFRAAVVFFWRNSIGMGVGYRAVVVGFVFG